MCSKETYLHGLVNNAGIMATPYEESGDKYEAQFQVNVFLAQSAVVQANSSSFALTADKLSLPLAAHIPSTASAA
jgi:NAD(P)-dependent dehydrogenase (short-subunit alcohol dehydrogenase family)